MYESTRLGHLAGHNFLECVGYDRHFHVRVLLVQMHLYAILVAINVENNIQGIEQIN